MPGYYLSKENRNLIELLVPKLRDRTEDLEFKCSRPEKFITAVRSACKHDEYKWIKEQFIVSRQENSVIFKIKQLILEEIIPPTEEIADKDFFDILNILLKQNKNRVNFTHCILTADELESIQEWCKNNKYEMNYTTDNILEVTRINEAAKLEG